MGKSLKGAGDLVGKDTAKPKVHNGTFPLVFPGRIVLRPLLSRRAGGRAGLPWKRTESGII